MKLFFIPRLHADKRPLAKTGITLVEALLTICILGLIMAAMVPFIHTVHTSWNLGDRKLQLQQNARIGLDTLSRIVRQTTKIISIPNTGSGNFIKLKDALDTQTLIFYHNIPGSPYYSGNSGLIRENDLVMATEEPNPAGNPVITRSLLAKSLTYFQIYFKDKNGQLTTKAKDVNQIDISLRVNDPQNLIPDTLDFASSISIRSQVKMRPVWVAEANFVVELSTENWIPGFSHPSSLSADPDAGVCWVADTGNNRIKKLSLSGEVLLNLGGFNQPRSVAVNPSTGECWVADTGNNRIIKLSAQGAILANISDFWQPSCVSLDINTQECWVADTNKDRVRKISPAGTILLTRSGFKNPLTVSVYPDTGVCWVADTENNRVKELSPDKGTFLLNLRGFNRPLSLSVDYTTGACWVADTDNNQVVKLDAAGNEELRLSGFTTPSAISISP